MRFFERIPFIGQAQKDAKKDRTLLRLKDPFEEATERFTQSDMDEEARNAYQYEIRTLGEQHAMAFRRERERRIDKERGLHFGNTPRNRWCIMLFWFAVALGFGVLVIWLLKSWLGFPEEKALIEIWKGNGVWSLIGLAFGAPIAYAVWLFRDQNNLWQIENARKDTNLKDFQQLAQWVAGLHFPKEEPETPADATPRVSSQKGSLQTITQREGAVSLQIAAVHQLGAFVHGEFGKHFVRPAFTLLQSLWLAQMQPHGDSHSSVHVTANGNLCRAITRTLLQENGWLMREHADTLRGSQWSGLNHDLPGLQQPWYFYGLDFTIARLTAVQWEGVWLQGANLLEADLQGSNLLEAQLQGADLTAADLQSTLLRKAQLQGTGLWFANLQGSDLRSANLQGANLSWANLQGAHLSQAELEGADLSFANLKEVTWTNVHVDAKTQIAVYQKDEDGYMLQHDDDDECEPLIDKAATQALKQTMIDAGVFGADQLVVPD